MDYKSTDETIDLISLFCAVAGQWRRCLIAALAGCILLGGFAVAKAFTARANPEAYEMMQQEYRTENEPCLSVRSQEVDNLRISLQGYEDYLKNSVLMQIDPYAQPLAEASFLITLPQDTQADSPAVLSTDPTDSVGNAYASALYQHIDWDALSEITGTAAVYLDELIREEWDSDSNLFIISVVGRTEQEAAALLQELVAITEELHGEISEDVGPHTLTQIGAFSTTKIDASLAEYQEDVYTWCEDQLYFLEAAEADLDEMEKRSAEIPTVPSSTELVKNAIKFGIIGAVLGGFLLAAYYAVFYLVKGSLHTEDDMAAQGISVLGVLSEQPKRSGIDRILQKLGGRLHSVSGEDVLKYASIKLEHLYPDGAKILFTGCIPSEDIGAVSAKLDTRSGKFQFVAGECIASSVQTLEQATACDAVVLVEKRDVSCLQTIRKEIVAAESVGKKISGCIIL